LRCRERLKRPAATSRLFSCLADAAQRAHQHSFPTRRSSDLIVAKAPGSCTSALKTNPACYYHPFEFATNATRRGGRSGVVSPWRSEEHTSELQSRGHLVCRLLLEKKHDALSVATEYKQVPAE